MKANKAFKRFKTSDQWQQLLHQLPTNDSTPYNVLNVLNVLNLLKGLKPNGHKDASISRYLLVSTKLSRDKYLHT